MKAICMSKNQLTCLTVGKTYEVLRGADGRVQVGWLATH